MKTLKRSLIGCTLLLLTSSTAFAEDSFHFSMSSGDTHAYYGLAGAIGSIIIHSSGVHANYGHDLRHYVVPRHHRHHRPHYRHGHGHGHSPVYGLFKPQPHRGHHGHAPHYDNHGDRHHHKKHYSHRNRHDHGYRHGGHDRHDGHDRHGRH